jgi:uncharacterized protein YqcC (DUF446 family)
MQSGGDLSGWKQWLKPSRLVPLVTIFGAGLAIVLSLLKIIQLSSAEEIIIALLALLAVDALNERLSFLERMGQKLGDLCAEMGKLPLGDIKLKKRSVLTGTVEGISRDAHCLHILGLNLQGVISHSLGFFERMATNPRNKLKFLMVEPGSAAMESAPGFELDTEERAQFIQTAVKKMKKLLENDNVELRYTSVAPPFSLLIFDPGESGGITQVELYPYKTPVDERPHFTLTQDKQPWYDFFTQQFEKFWKDAKTPEEVEGGPRPSEAT